MDDISPVADVAKVSPLLWIGSCEAPLSSQFLRREKIGLIINVANEHLLNSHKIPTVKYHKIRDVDVNGNFRQRARTIEIAESASYIIHLAHNAKISVLVHCHAGVNRSAFIIAYYLRRYCGYSAADAIAAVRRANSIQRDIQALVNQSFISLINGNGDETSPPINV